MTTNDKHLSIYCDGGARGNPGPAAAAFVVTNDQRKVVYQQGKYLGEATNNQAEYEAVWMALNWLAQNHSDTEAKFFLDSQLVVNQLQGKFKIKDPILKIKYLEIKTLIETGKIIHFIYVPRSKNFLADTLVNQTIDRQNSAWIFRSFSHLEN